MKKTDIPKVSEKRNKIDRERERILEVFKDLEKERTDLILGLIDDAAYLRIANEELRDILIVTGTVKVHPTNPEIQKPTEAAKQYRQNVNSYAVVIKSLGAVLGKEVGEGDDPLDAWLKEKHDRRKKQSD